MIGHSGELHSLAAEITTRLLPFGSVMIDDHHEQGLSRDGYNGASTRRRGANKKLQYSLKPFSSCVSVFVFQALIVSFYS